MSAYLRQELRARGAAQVIVIVRSAFGTGASAGGRDERRLERHFFRDTTTRSGALAASLGSSAPAFRFYPHLGVFLGTVSRDGLAALRSDPRVVTVVGAPALSPIRPRRRAPATLDRDRTWGIERLGAPALWDRGLTGRGVLVAHLDTGVDAQHPALRGAIARFGEFDVMGRPVLPSPPPRPCR